MTRVRQPQGTRGSLKWIQRAVNCRADGLAREFDLVMGDAGQVRWLSPRAEDDYAEYRDSSFLDLIGHPELTGKLADFWPRKGPQWDAVGKGEAGSVLLIEAKAHVGEILSPPSAAGIESRRKIQDALQATALYMGSTPKAPWIDTFYQLANRYAHLHFLRSNGVDARLVLVNFINDEDMGGPKSAGEWKAAYQVVDHVMGIAAGNPLGRHVFHIYPSVSDLAVDPVPPA